MCYRSHTINLIKIFYEVEAAGSGQQESTCLVGIRPQTLNQIGLRGAKHQNRTDIGQSSCKSLKRSILLTKRDSPLRTQLLNKGHQRGSKLIHVILIRSSLRCFLMRSTGKIQLFCIKDRGQGLTCPRQAFSFYLRWGFTLCTPVCLTLRIQNKRILNSRITDVHHST